MRLINGIEHLVFSRNGALVIIGKLIKRKFITAIKIFS